ncbi:MAG: asparagine synthase (glutamine-hydrolyzing) [Elusimicrobiota bacterium]
MCGICGIINYNGRSVDKDLLVRMNSLLAHRGPDDEGYYFGSSSNRKKNIGLAMKRLSIIDLESGHQPIHNEDKTKWIVFNGENYSFQQSRKTLEGKHRFYTVSDVESVVHLYEEYGSGCLEHLRGMFAFAIWDEKKDTLFLARDRLGQKPLYYTWQEGNFYFSSEMKSFLEIPEFRKQVNIEAIDHYLTYQFIPAPMTIWKNVYALKPATYMLVDSQNTVSTGKYWDLDFRTKTGLTYEESKLKIRELLKEATRLRMIADVPLGLFLSGGHDSSIIAGLMSEISQKQIKTFSIGFNEDEFSELEYARIIAERLNTDHHEFIVKPGYIDILEDIVWYYDQPYADCSALPSYFLTRETRKHVKVALNGDGGDENFTGYLKLKALKASRYVSPFFKIMPDAALKLILKCIPMNESIHARKSMRYVHRFIEPIKDDAALKNIIWRAYFTSEMKNQIYSEDMKEDLKGADSYRYLLDIFRNAPADNDMDRMLYSDIVSYLPDDLLVKMDIASMANSLETRSPFLDHKLIEFTSSLPANWKLKGFESKYILKDTFRDYLPDKIMKRGKQGFSIPLGKWFRGELKDYMIDTLLSSDSLGRGYFNENNLKGFINSHISGKKDYGFCLWALLMLELWHKVFIDADVNAGKHLLR